MLSDGIVLFQDCLSGQGLLALSEWNVFHYFLSAVI